MKKLIGFGIAAMMVMGLAGAANAAFDASWAVNWKVSTSATADAANASGSFKTLATATNPVTAPPTGSGALVYAYSTNHGGDYTTDCQASFKGTTIKWNISLGSVRFATAPTQVALLMWNPKDTAPTAVNNAFVSGGETLKLWKADANFNKTTLAWDFGLAANAGKGTGAYADAATFNSGLIDINSKYVLEVAPAEQVVPEPGSVVAMLSGLVGLAGYGIRRRK